MDKDSLNQFAKDWIDTWNSHDLKSIMEHYDINVEFYSPIIKQMGVNAAGNINNKNDLKNYFEAALKKYPDLKFELIQSLEGVNSLVLFYKSINNRYSAEYMELNEAGKIIKVRAHYTSQ